MALKPSSLSPVCVLTLLPPWCPIIHKEKKVGFYRVSYSSNCDGTKEFSCFQMMHEKYIRLLLHHTDLITLFLCESGHIWETLLLELPPWFFFPVILGNKVLLYYIKKDTYCCGLYFSSLLQRKKVFSAVNKHFLFNKQSNNSKSNEYYLSIKL